MPSFIIPALNEGDAIADTVNTVYENLKALGISDYQIILINDGSTDDSGAIVDDLAAKDENILAVHHSENEGLGASIREGVRLATKAQFLVVPGDNDISSESLSLLLSCRDVAQLVLTVPMNKEARPHSRQIISLVYQTLHNVFFYSSVGYINGPGVWPTELVKKADLKSNRFSIISEMNVKLLTQGLTFAEVPIYFQAGEPVRATVTWRNLVEVVKIFMMLVVEINFKSSQKKRPRRVQINFSANP